MSEIETLKLRLKAIDAVSHPEAARKIEKRIAELEASPERWIDPDVLKSFKAALPATEADGGISWPYSLWDGTRWVAFSNLAELEAATMPESNEKIIEKTLSKQERTMNDEQRNAIAEAEIFLIELAEADLPAHKSTDFKSLMADVDQAIKNAIENAAIDEGQSLVEKVLARRRRYMAWLEKMAGAVATPAKANGSFGDGHIKIVNLGA